MNDNDFFYLFDASKNVIDHARKNENKVSEAVVELRGAIGAFEQKAIKIKSQIELDVKKAIESSAVDVVNIISKKFIEADRFAEKAAIRYGRALSWSNWKLIGVAILVYLLSVIAITVFLRTTIPSQSEIEALRVEEQKLMANIAKLKDNGGKISIGNCDGRLCVKIDQKAGTFGDGYFIVNGY